MAGPEHRSAGWQGSAHRLATLAALALALAAAPRGAPAQAQTRPGLEIGLEAYRYAYREPNFVAQSGPYAGVNARYTVKAQSFFLTVDGIAGLGYLDYTSSGTGRRRGIWNYTGDLRILGGEDLALSSQIVASPYLGLGYRVLFDAAGGRSTTTGAIGYDRLSQYLYVPLGATLGIRAGAWALRPNLEFDYLIQGWQGSYLAQAGFDNDIVNRQKHGYGLRGSLLAATATGFGQLAFGPFIRYWNIRSSAPRTLFLGGAAVATAVEPANNTLEFGALVKLGF